MIFARMTDAEGWLLIAIIIYFVPTIIAFKRDHHYKWPIFGLNLAGFTGFAWLAAFVWAVWPRETTVIDVIAQPLVDPRESPRIYSLNANDSKSISRQNTIDIG